MDELVLTLLSQATSDVNRDKAFDGLRRRFPNDDAISWENVAHAPVAEIEAAIKPGGIARVKARRIVQILDEVERREGALDLSRLARLDDESVVDYLCGLPGVGPKTAACVLAFSMGRDAFPVDTHVLRIAIRLGLVDPKTSAEKTHAVLAPQVPPSLGYDLHVALIHHGRTVCTARAPRCSRCVLFDLCDAGPVLLAEGRAR